MNAPAADSPVFFDTNIFLYADDPRDYRKQTRAVQLIRDHIVADLAMVSVQVMQEYFAAATRKLMIDVGLARRKVELMSKMRVVQPTATSVLSAIDLHARSQISIWDALIVVAAREGGAAVLFSEDLKHGSVLAGVTVINPFEL